MNITKTIITLLAASIVGTAPVSAADDSSTRAERRHITEGNRLYREKRFSEAEVQYNKALQANSQSMTASYNLAAALLRQASPGESGKILTDKAIGLLSQVVKDGDAPLAQLAAYNLGNVAYNAQQWDKSIEYYKEALRRNPADDKARQNLRMAQLKKKQQDQNKDDKKDDKKDDQKDDKKDQNKNQDKDKNQNQNQDQDQNKDQQPQQPQQPQGGISPENAEKILKAMENEEAATRRRVQAAEKRKGSAGRRVVTKPW